MSTATQMHCPTIAQTDAPVLNAANIIGPPDGFDPARDGAIAWLALRMQHAITE